MSTVSSTKSGYGTDAIDVAAIVKELMVAESKPLAAINTKILQKSTAISDLGVIKSKVSTFYDALNNFEDPKSYNARQVATTDSSVITASSSNGTQTGNYAIEVSSIAESSKYNVTGFTSSTAPLSFDGTGVFSISVGGTSYTTAGSPAGTPTITSSPTVTNLSDWINSLGLDVSASVVQGTSSTDYVLMIQSTLTGTDNEITAISGLSTGGTYTSTHTSASDAVFTFGGVSFVRSSNTVDDIVDGLTFNILDTNVGSPVTLKVASSTADYSTVLETLVATYNDMITTYQGMVANSSTTKTPGTFANSPTTLSFINEIKSRFAEGGYYDDSYSTQMSMSWLGVTMQTDGTLEFDSSTLASAIDSGATDILSQGVKIGYVEDGDTLADYAYNYVKDSGYLDELVSYTAEQGYDLESQQNNIQLRLDKIQNSYITQYSALNALLYQLSVTNSALTSAIDALNNQNN